MQIYYILLIEKLLWNFSSIPKVGSDIGRFVTGSESQPCTSCHHLCCFYFRYYIDIREVRFVAEHDQYSGWNHITVDFLGPEDGQGIRIYRNGLQDASDDSTYSITVDTGDDITVVGRYYTNQDNYYTSLEIDELAFFNAKLSEDQIYRNCSM